MLRTIAALVVMTASAVLTGCAADTGPVVGPASAGDVPSAAPPSAVAAPRMIMIIRHAEKPDGVEPGLTADGTEDDSSLTAVGWDRAHRLVGLFDPAQGAPREGLTRPEAIYAAGVTDEGEGQRTRETVAPLADALGLPVDTEYGKGDEKKLVKEILADSGTTLISWQHSEIPGIVDAFPKVTPKPPEEWPSERFDVVWTLTRTADGWAFAQVPELVLPQDSADVIEAD